MKQCKRLPAMLRVLVICLFIFSSVLSKDEEEKKYRSVKTEQGTVIAEKYWDGDFYEFYGIPYATAPKGRDRFKDPLPAKPWDGGFFANNNKILCNQKFYTGEDDDEVFSDGEDDCLVINLLVPEVASEENLVPVLVYIHSGAFAVGNGNMAKYQYLARRDIIVVSYNFRLGAIGFACLGTEEIPGNAGMKDQVAALRWINKNIKKFGGDPNKVTIAGFSVGAAMAELLLLSKSTEGLIDKMILESGSALSPFTINIDPIGTATNIAKSMGYNGTNLKELNEFYLNAKDKILASKSLNFFLTNSTFGFSPCIEKENTKKEAFLTELPLDIMNRGDYPKVPVLTGFASMEGLSRTLKFSEWSVKMNENLADFLPTDLTFDSEKSKNDFLKQVKEYYFNNKEVSKETLQGYIDFFSDSMFKYSILKSANIHAERSNQPVYFYEFNFVGNLGMRHDFMDRVKGASHRDQTAYLLDFLSFTKDIDDMIIRDRMTWMWTDFVKYGDPTAFESQLVDYKWLKYTKTEQNYLHIDLKKEMKKDILTSGYNFWDKVYQKYYWKPKAASENKVL